MTKLRHCFRTHTLSLFDSSQVWNLSVTCFIFRKREGELGNHRDYALILCVICLWVRKREANDVLHYVYLKVDPIMSFICRDLSVEIRTHKRLVGTLTYYDNTKRAIFRGKSPFQVTVSWCFEPSHLCGVKWGLIQVTKQQLYDTKWQCTYAVLVVVCSECSVTRMWSKEILARKTLTRLDRSVNNGISHACHWAQR